MSRRGRAILDAVGAGLVLSYVGAVLVAAREAGDPVDTVRLIVAVAGALVLARLIGLAHRAPVPFLIAVAAATLLATADGVVGGGPLGGPFGYRNATGAFFAQAAVAALMAGFAFRAWAPRALGLAAGALFAVVALADSSAGAGSLIVLVPAGLGLLGWIGARTSVALAGSLFALALVGTIALGAWYRPGADGPVVEALTERRLALWHESLEIVAERPGGVGPGRFAEVAPTALEDRDAAWAHQEFLEQGVEVGWAGLALLVALFLWGFVRLWAHPAPDAVVVLGAAALGALGIHATVDYVLHFPAVPLVAAALVGTAQAAPSRRLRRGKHEAREEGVEGAAHPDRVAGASASG